MASKWKYADLDAQHRLELLKKGNKELFDEEVERTREVTNARRELGLDTTEQERWMDTVGYNYNLHLSDGSTPVSKSGYANLYLNEKKPDTVPSSVKRNRSWSVPESTPYSDALWKIEEARKLARQATEARFAQEKAAAREELYGRYPHLKEQLLNQGASLEGGKVKRAYELLEKRLSEIYAELDLQLSAALEAVDKRYAGINRELDSYRVNGASKSSYGVIAEALIRRAAHDYGYDSSLIPGIGSKTKYKDDEESEDSKMQDAAVKNALEEDNDEASLAETSRSDVVIDESTGEASTTDKAYDGILKVADSIKKDPENAVAAIGKMLMLNGMSDTGAIRTAIELVELFMKRTGAQA